VLQRAHRYKEADRKDRGLPRGHARVKSGNLQKQDDPLTTFEVCKQNARWMIILGTMSTGPAIIMEHPY